MKLSTFILILAILISLAWFGWEHTLLNVAGCYLIGYLAAKMEINKHNRR